ncbi:sugar phosphate isomerase/epimerase [Ruficoccus amylovorans]|uniref:Sugar phosphate isomerase/epimerase n=1 Tax=Ruficoccus amylovorans TaxID=1804625 RepID=A0A842HA84_9BACT|nr:TIM barrel protein [Ruficoccus amylovorans]MBC2593210.1 sugar phosphate isomerase/epimerase [Ruficoccus amylovorans]
MNFPIHLVLDEIDWDPRRALPVAQGLGIRTYTLRMINQRRYPDVPEEEHRWLESLRKGGVCRFDVISPGINKGLFDEKDIGRVINEAFPKCLAAARRIGAKDISLFSWAKALGALPPSTAGGLSPSAPVKAICAALRQMADMAARAGLTISVEVGYQCWGDTGLATAQLIEAADHPALHMLWDPCNSLCGRALWLGNATANRAFTDPVSVLTAELEQVAGLINGVHVRDLVLCPPKWEYVLAGRGQVDWTVLTQALWSYGYRGPLMIEHHIPAPDKEAATRHTARYLEQIIHTKNHG